VTVEDEGGEEEEGQDGDEHEGDDGHGVDDAALDPEVHVVQRPQQGLHGHDEENQRYDGRAAEGGRWRASTPAGPGSQ